MGEEIINALTHIENLHVIARTSAFYFKGKDVKVHDIGKELNVETVLEGSVRKAGNRLRITAQLINVADGYHLWAEKYDRDMEDIFAIQDEISLAIVDALKIKLLKKEKATIEKRLTIDTEAYELYLWGRYNYQKYDTFKAKEYFLKAVDKDPNFASAYSGIADCYIGAGYFGHMSPKEAYPKAEEHINNALDIDNNLTEAHISKAAIKWSYYWDFPTAERDLKRILELNPGSADAHMNYAWCIEKTGRFKEALEVFEQARKLDPFNLMIYASKTVLYLVLGDNENAKDQMNKIKAIDPNVIVINNLSGLVYVLTKKYNDAIEALLKDKEDSAYYYMSKAFLGYTYGISGERNKADQILKEMLQVRENKYVSATDIAIIYIGLGEIDNAFVWLENASKAREPQLLARNMFLFFDPIHSDPRFKDLLIKMGLPE